MRLIKLELRGAIGIHHGLGLEEIVIDFEKFGDGIIALIGKNGAGKTTILENLHPFRRLVSRSGNLSDHFYLKDSYRKLTFSFNNSIYRSEIYIDAFTKKVEAYLYKNDTAITDGKLTTYDKAVTELFGSEEIFFASIFSAQKHESFARLSASQRRELFYQILNLDKYAILYEKANEQLKEEQNKAMQNEAKILNLSESIKDAEETINRYSNAEQEYNITEQMLDKLIKQRDALIIDKEKLITRIASLQAIMQRNNSIEKEILSLQKDLDELKKKNNELELDLGNVDIDADVIINDLTSSISELQAKIKNNKEKKNQLEGQLANTNKNELLKHIELREELLRKYTEVNDKENTLNKELLANEQQKNTKVKELEAKYNTELLLNEINKIETQLKLAETEHKLKIERINEQIKNAKSTIQTITTVPCTEEVGRGCKFLTDAYKTKDSLQELIDTKEKLVAEHVNKAEELNNKKQDLIKKAEEVKNNYQEEIKKIEISYANKKGEIAAIIDKIKLQKIEISEQLKDIEVFANKVKEIEQLEHALLNINNTIQSLEQLLKEKNESLKREQNNKKEKLEALAKQREELKANYSERISKTEGKIKELQTEYDLLAETEYENVLQTKEAQELEIKNINAQIEMTNKKLQELNARKQLLNDAYNKKDKLTKQMQQIQEEAEKIQRNIYDWSLLTKAFNKTGIPVLKMEHSANVITSIANDLLRFFDQDFRIAIETTKFTKDLKKTKEVFDINVIDSEGVTGIENKSGGQQVWIETAIQLAISILLRQNGKKIETAFMDEKDGALDPENAYNYLQMIEEAHRLGGAYQTLLITHREELQKLIDNKIILKEGSIILS